MLLNPIAEAGSKLESGGHMKTNRLPPTYEVDIARLQFLNACERLGIPRDKWPIFGDGRLELPVPVAIGQSSGIAVGSPPVFRSPAFDLFIDDRRSYGKKVNRVWRTWKTQDLAMYLKRSIRTQELVTVKGNPPRFNGEKRKNAIPLEIRYEWAALHYCCGTAWTELAKRNKGYQPDCIRKVAGTILRLLELWPEVSARQERANTSAGQTS